MELNGGKRGDIFVEGIDVIIRRDLEKHTALLEQNNINIQHFRDAQSNEIKKKQFYGEQKGKRKYRDADMDKAISQMNINIKHISNRIKIAEELKKENTVIVDTLTEQLKDYDKGMKNYLESLKLENLN